jgi:N-acetylmuramoyl-L-alanine amidase
LKIHLKILLIPLLIVLVLVFPSGTDADSGKKLLLNSRIIKGIKYLSVHEILTVLKPDHSFNFITRRGRIFSRSRQVAYRVGYQIVIINGRKVRAESPVIQDLGEPLVPMGTGIEMIRGLYPDVSIHLKKNTLAVSFKKKDSKTTVDRKPEGRTSVSRKKDRIGFIVIDPGHGGKDPGALGRGGVREKSITLGISKLLSSLLKSKLKGIKIILTRKRDRFIELSKRTEIGNRYLKKYGNGIFLSIHVNASISPKISGYETYFLSQNASNEDARNTAALENNVIVLEDRSKSKKYGDIDYIEAMMITTQIQKESSLLAASIQNGMSGKVKNFKSRGVRKADFFVLRGALMPAVLVEVGFITNSKELRFLKKTSHRRKIALGISDGIVRFIEKYNRSLVKGF